MTTLGYLLPPILQRIFDQIQPHRPARCIHCGHRCTYADIRWTPIPGAGRPGPMGSREVTHLDRCPACRRTECMEPDNSLPAVEEGASA